MSIQQPLFSDWQAEERQEPQPDTEKECPHGYLRSLEYCDQGCDADHKKREVRLGSKDWGP